MQQRSNATTQQSNKATTQQLTLLHLQVRTITGLGLKEAKEMVEGAPKTIKKDVKKEEAEELVEKLKAAGGEAELE